MLTGSTYRQLCGTRSSEVFWLGLPMPGLPLAVPPFAPPVPMPVLPTVRPGVPLLDGLPAVVSDFAPPTLPILDPPAGVVWAADAETRPIANAPVRAIVRRCFFICYLRSTIQLRAVTATDGFTTWNIRRKRHRHPLPYVVVMRRLQ